MPSSISPFRRLPRRTLVLIAVGLAALLACAIYTCVGNPEVRGMRYAYAGKMAFCRQLDQDPAPKMIFTGGSSCAHQIDTTLLNDSLKLRSVNLGHLAGVGLYVNTAIGLAAARPGDSLVLAIEPEDFNDTGVTQLGYQFLASTGSSKTWKKLQSLGVSLSRTGEINALRPGLYHLVTLFSKILLRRPLDRFEPSGLAPDGFEQEAARRQLPGMEAGQVRISSEARDFLQRVAAQAREQNIRVAYLLPWGLYRPGEESRAREDNRRLLIEVDRILPVLQDDHFGVWDHAADFSDTELHLTRDGAVLRTTFLAPTLEQWRVYTSQDLSAAR